ncbi:transketolase [Gracilibacillus halophilus YIM-C55.5]|uniref:Transketolase n=1 Tax=Gracilibacillus halophilus YIM-C55.5 TaxID=1308866 RepID=N4W6P4_9BACI|nr:transketolase [Gracilibacillus halophilus]ENH95898.1 transketolase [Gracilibacillus halophilus YIM-C55.5]
MSTIADNAVATEQQVINTVRMLSIDMIEQANSGHPGLPMGAAPMAHELWSKHMKHNPANPNWFDRDRFILSAGHGSALLYSLLHLHGYDVSLDDLKQFRQYKSKTPGHPEYGHTPGVEATTGPLGQGLAMATGMAITEKYLAARYNQKFYPIIDHFTYCLCGDGDIMEGVSQEAASLAGHLKLGKLIVFYDSNDISLDGDLDQSFSENVGERYKANGWQVLRVEDGNNLDEINEAIQLAQQNRKKPTLIEVKTTIGYGAPNKAGTAAAHGAPLGEEEIKRVKENYGWEETEAFTIPENVHKFYQAKQTEFATKEEKWHQLYEAYAEKYPLLAKELSQVINGELPEHWMSNLPEFSLDAKPSTREASGKVINEIAKALPHYIGGSADLSGSNKTTMNGARNFLPNSYDGRNIWFGVREFAMGAALNGMMLHGGVKAFGGTFFVFSDYLRSAIRSSALMQLPVTYVFTHDSIAVGEDGPTHEPIEQLASLRAMPNVSVIRPADGNEVAAAWQLAISSQDTPHALVLSRQGIPTSTTSFAQAADGVAKGAYVISEADQTAEGVLLASGSEVALAIKAQKALAQEDIHVNVVSMPSWDRFEQQSQSYKEQVIPSQLKKRLAIEMGASLGWHKYVGDHGDMVTIDQFGASGKGDILQEEYGFTVENVVQTFKHLK